MEHSVIHFEIPAKDLKRAEAFYEKAFGWDVNYVPEYKYAMVMTGEMDEKTRMPKKPGYINGGMMGPNEKIKNPVITIHAKDAKKAIEAVKTAGGEVVMEPFKVGDMGVAAYFKDTEGNVMGIWQPKEM